MEEYEQIHNERVALKQKITALEKVFKQKMRELKPIEQEISKLHQDHRDLWEREVDSIPEKRGLDRVYKEYLRCECADSVTIRVYDTKEHQLKRFDFYLPLESISKNDLEIILKPIEEWIPKSSLFSFCFRISCSAFDDDPAFNIDPKTY